MYRGNRVAVVMPAFNAAKTIRKTYREVMDQGIVDEVIIVDDASEDSTVEIAREFPNSVVHVHSRNLGYGANQKSCYDISLKRDADIIIMVHPDYQYTPKLIPAMVSLIGNDLYHCVLGSRILGGHAVKNGMPAWKYLANRFLTLIENILIGGKLSEYHTGYRAFSRRLLEEVAIENNSDGFVFDNQMITQIIWMGYAVAEVTCPTKYFPEASSIDFIASVKYGFGCLKTAFEFRMARMKVLKIKRYPNLNVNKKDE